VLARLGSGCGFYFGRACGNDSAVPTESPERRRQTRINLSQVLRIRPFDPSLPPEYCTTFNVSQNGLYFATSAGHYSPGVNVYVTTDFQPDSPLNRAVAGVVVRVDKLEDDKWGVAIHIFSPSSSTAE
jgi:PilZ domain